MALNLRITSRASPFEVGLIPATAAVKLDLEVRAGECSFLCLDALIVIALIMFYSQYSQQLRRFSSIARTRGERGYPNLQCVALISHYLIIFSLNFYDGMVM